MPVIILSITGSLAGQTRTRRPSHIYFSRRWDLAREPAPERASCRQSDESAARIGLTHGPTRPSAILLRHEAKIIAIFAFRPLLNQPFDLRAIDKPGSQRHLFEAGHLQPLTVL